MLGNVSPQQSQVENVEGRHLAAAERLNAAAVLAVEAKKHPSAQEGLTQVEFHQVTRRIAQKLMGSAILCFLEAVAGAAFEGKRQLAFDFEFEATGVDILEVAKDQRIRADQLLRDQTRCQIVESRRRQPDMRG